MCSSATAPSSSRPRSVRRLRRCSPMLAMRPVLLMAFALAASSSRWTSNVAGGVTMNDVTRDFDRLLAEMRPKLHRYCARMTASSVDGEDVVQEAMIKALTALPTVDSIENPQGWLFRIAHNAALDFLRRR